MIYYTTKVRVRSGGKALRFYIVEDLTDRSKVYTLEKSVCNWFDSIVIGNILEVVAQSDGIILNVIRPTEIDEILHDDIWDFDRELAE